MISRSSDEKRTMKTDADMETFFKELVPHLSGIQKLVAKYEDKTVDICIREDFIQAGVFNTGYEMTKYKSHPYRIRKEFSLMNVEEVI